jgi:hypothetical protein
MSNVMDEKSAEKRESVFVEVFGNNKVEIPEILQRDEDEEIWSKTWGEDEKDRRLYRILGKYGDERIVWNCRVLAEIAAAKKMFTDLLSKGMLPYKVGTDGKRTSEVMSEFDAGAEEVIFLPVKAIAGG